MVNTNSVALFQGEILRKKLKKNTWKEYRVILQEDRLVFMNENEKKIAGVITLTEETTCKVLERKESSRQSSDRSSSKNISRRKRGFDDGPCKFKLYAKRGVHLLKTDCKSSCDHWIGAISRVVQSMWINSQNGPSSTKARRHRFMNWLHLDCNVTKQATNRNGFSYNCLLEEENLEDHFDEIERNSVIENGTQPVLRSFTSPKGKFKMWKNISSRIISRYKAGNYGVLVEDITD